MKNMSPEQLESVKAQAMARGLGSGASTAASPSYTGPPPKMPEPILKGPLRKAEIYKNEGNALFRMHDYKGAVAKYEAGITEFSIADVTEDTGILDSEDAIEKVRTACHLNLAASLLKLFQYPRVIRECGVVLKRSPNNLKALFRRGQALGAMEKWKEAEKDLGRGLFSFFSF